MTAVFQLKQVRKDLVQKLNNVAASKRHKTVVLFGQFHSVHAILNKTEQAVQSQRLRKLHFSINIGDWTDI